MKSRTNTADIFPNVPNQQAADMSTPLLPQYFSFMSMLSWLIVILCALLMFRLTKNSSLDWGTANFLVIFSATIGMWVFRLVPEYIPAVIIIMAALLLNIAPEQVIFSGFHSDSFFLALTVFAVSAAIIKSRLFYRLSLILLIHMPAKESILQKFLFFLGVLMTPLMSVQSSRVTLIAPLLDDILKSSKIHPQSNTANALANAAFNGCILLSTIFLTGKSSNYIIFSLLSEQNQWQGNWLNWLWAASFPGLLLIISFFMIQSYLFKPHKTIKINFFHLKRESHSLGSLSPAEFIAIICLSLFFIGTFLSGWKNISSIWTCISVFLLLAITGTLNAKEFKIMINWGFLFYFGAIIGVIHVIQNTSIDQWLIHHLQWLIDIGQINVIYFIVAVYIISWLIGLLLGTMVAPALLFTTIMPLAKQCSTSGWVIAFVILIATEAWIFPYQSSYFLCFQDLLKRKNNFLLDPLLKVNALFSLLKLGIILLSIPLWYSFGILS